jgi:hypothetical protein
MVSRARKRKRRTPGYRAPRAKSLDTGGAAQNSTETAGTVRRRRTAPGGKPERPPAPWGSFPLVELVVLFAIIMLIAGFFVQGTRGVTMIGAGLMLGMLAGLELSIREHFAGYKSHTSVLAGVAAVAVLGLGFFLLPKGWPQGVNVVAGATVFAAAFYLLREAFKRRSGGVGFR